MKNRCAATNFIIISLFIIILNACSTFNGYYYDLNKVREESKIYKNSDFTFTKETNNLIIDSVIKDNALYIIEIVIKNTDNKLKYKIKHTSSFSIEESIAQFSKSPEYIWNKSSELSPAEYSWCIVSKDFNDKHNCYLSYEFIYASNTYNLIYRF